MTKTVDNFFDELEADCEGERVKTATEYKRRFPGLDSVIDDALAALADETAASPVSIHIRRFRIIEELGCGGMGIVYRAWDPRLRREVALKLLRSHSDTPRGRARFEQEARALSGLDHPNLASLFEVGLQHETPFLVMQLVEGDTLDTRLKRARKGIESLLSPSGRQTDLDQLLELFETIGLALHHAHTKGLVHRDVKPGNIKITANGKPVVLDFGLVLDATSSQQLSVTGGKTGTPLYMAPEQVRGDTNRIDARTDVYALGLTLYECLTLQPAFKATTQAALFHEVLNGAPVRLGKSVRGLPRDLRIAVECAVDRDPQCRYASAAAFAEDLRRVRCREPILARRTGVALRVARWIQRNPTAAVVMLLMAVGLGAVFALSARVARAEEKSRKNAAERTLQAADSARQLGEWNQAVALYDNALSLGHEDETGILLSKFEVFEADSQPAKAAKLVQELARRSNAGPHEARAALLVGCERITTDYARGSSALRRALALHEIGDSTLAEADAEYARALLEESITGACKHLRKALIEDPRHLPSLCTLGPLLLFAGDPRGTLDVAQRMEIAYPREIRSAAMLRSMAMAVLGHEDDARHLLAQADVPDDLAGLMQPIAKGLSVVRTGFSNAARKVAAQAVDQPLIGEDVSIRDLLAPAAVTAQQRLPRDFDGTLRLRIAPVIARNAERIMAEVRPQLPHLALKMMTNTLAPRDLQAVVGAITKHYADTGILAISALLHRRQTPVPANHKPRKRTGGNRSNS